MADQDIYWGKYFPQLDLYGPFHDYKWARETIEPLVVGTKIESVAFLLLGQWLKASTAFRYPTLMMGALKATNEAYLNRYDPYTALMMDALKIRVHKDYKPEVTVTQFNKLVALIETYKTQLAEDLKESRVVYDMQSTFMGNLNAATEFKLALIAITEQAFCSIYFAYELFIKRCYQLLSSDYATKASSPAFSGKLKAVLNDDSLHAMVWTCDDVIDAKEARHSIAHDDGGVGPKLNPHVAYYEIAPATSSEPSRMFILTPGVHVLYYNLKVRVEKLIRHILSKP